MGEGPATKPLTSTSKARFYAAIAAATVMGVGLAVGTSGGRRERGAGNRRLGDDAARRAA